MDVLEFTGIKPLGITREACERYNVPQVKTKYGVKLGAIFSDECVKALSTDGGGFWVGEYDPNLGLFGQKAVIPGKPVIIVPTELEALKLASLGFDSISIPEPRQDDSLTFTILAENLQTVTREIWVWGDSPFRQRQEVLEKFLLHLASSVETQFKLSSIDGSNAPILTTTKEDVKDILTNPSLRPWKPSGIAFVDELMDGKDFWKPVVGVKTGYACIDKSNEGVRTSEITLFTAGTGIGKSTIVREIAFHIGTVENHKVGMVFLEEGAEKTAKSLASIMYNIPYSTLRQNPGVLSEKQWQAFRNKIGKNFVFHRHFGSINNEALFSKIEYMALFCGCKFICLDHISIAVSGLSSKEGERKDIDILMTRLAMMAVCLDIGFIVVSHLSVPEGAPHEEGGKVTLSHLRGSGGIKQMSWSIFAMERNQQDPDCTAALIRQLKGRDNNGNTGPIGVVRYHRDTGRLLEDTTWDPIEFERQLSPRRKGNLPNNYAPAKAHSEVSNKWVGGY